MRNVPLTVNSQRDRWRSGIDVNRCERRNPTAGLQPEAISDTGNPDSIEIYD
jgi:hypothetical protein